MAHGWFDFPEQFYAELFEARNGKSFETFKTNLIYWKDPASQKVNLERLRTKESTFLQHLKTQAILCIRWVVQESKSSRKLFIQKNLRPCVTCKTIVPCLPHSPLQVSTTAKTLVRPNSDGLSTLKDFEFNEVEINSEAHRELHLTFYDSLTKRTTAVHRRMYMEQVPVLASKNANSGWKSSMGFGNHTFYETYQEHITCNSKENPYYAFLADENNHWLDSHKVGIDEINSTFC